MKSEYEIFIHTCPICGKKTKKRHGSFGYNESTCQSCWDKTIARLEHIKIK